MEFLNFNQVGLISYFFHGDLNNTSSIRDSSRETSLESISGGGRPEGDRSMPHPLQRVEGISKSKNLDQNTCTLFNTFAKCKYGTVKIFLNIKKNLDRFAFRQYTS